MEISGEFITAVIAKFREDNVHCSSTGVLLTIEGSLSEMIEIRGMCISPRHFDALLERLEKETRK